MDALTYSLAALQHKDLIALLQPASPVSKRRGRCQGAGGTVTMVTPARPQPQENPTRLVNIETEPVHSKQNYAAISKTVLTNRRKKAPQKSREL